MLCAFYNKNYSLSRSKSIYREIIQHIKLKNSQNFFNYIDVITEFRKKKKDCLPKFMYKIVLFGKFFILEKSNYITMDKPLPLISDIILYKFLLIFKHNDLFFIFYKNNNDCKTLQSIIYNLFYGKFFTYFLKLKLQGMGFKANVNLNLKKFKFTLGFSHKIFYNYKLKYLLNILIYNKTFQGVSILLRSNKISSLYNNAHKICLLKQVDPYKHKGFFLNINKLVTKKAKKQTFLF